MNGFFLGLMSTFRSIISFSDSDSKIILIAKWLACVYRSLDEFHDNQEVFNTLMTMKIIPLVSKEYVALEDNTVFFPITSEQKSRSQYRGNLFLHWQDWQVEISISVDKELSTIVKKNYTYKLCCKF